jgi:hypothetical protein
VNQQDAGAQGLDRGHLAGEGAQSTRAGQTGSADLEHEGASGVLPDED